MLKLFPFQSDAYKPTRISYQDIGGSSYTISSPPSNALEAAVVYRQLEFDAIIITISFNPATMTRYWYYCIAPLSSVLSSLPTLHWEQVTSQGTVVNVPAGYGLVLHANATVFGVAT